MKEGQNCGECWQWVLDCSNVVNLLYELAVMICNLCFGIHHDKSNLGPACMKKSESKILACKKDMSTITSFYIFYCFVLHTFITSPPAPRHASPPHLLHPTCLPNSCLPLEACRSRLLPLARSSLASCAGLFSLVGP